MINIRFIISTLLLIAISIATPTFAGEYKVIVLPNSTIDVSHKNKINNVDIEEMLAKKIISRMEAQGLACSPTLDILRIGIINNPYFSPNASNPMNNAKIISKSYNVPKVLLVSSKVIVKNPNQQKEFWKAMNIPALTSSEADLRLITKVTMYDLKTDQVLWSDVYQQKMAKASDGMKGIKIAKVNSYYDRITDRMLEDLKTTTSTSAILIGENRIPEWGRGGQYAINNKHITTEKAVKTVSAKAIPNASNVETVQPKVTTVKLTRNPQNAFIKKIQLSFHNKYIAFKNFQTKREIENAQKLVEDKPSQVKEHKITLPKLSFKKQQNPNKRISEKTEQSKLKLHKKETKNITEKKIAKVKPLSDKKSIKKTETNVAEKQKTVKNKSNSFGKNIASSMNKTKQNVHNFMANLKPKKSDTVAKKEQTKTIKKVEKKEKLTAQNTKTEKNLKPEKKTNSAGKNIASSMNKTKQNIHKFIANLKPKKSEKVAKKEQTKKIKKVEKKEKLTAQNTKTEKNLKPEKKTNSAGKNIASSMNRTKQNIHKFIANLKPKKSEKIVKDKAPSKQLQQNKEKQTTIITKKAKPEKAKSEQKQTVITNKKTPSNKVKTAKQEAAQTKQANIKKQNFGEKLSNKVKGKYTQVKQAYIEQRNKQIKQERKEEHYTTVIAPINSGDENNINSYIQTKPRNNSWNYTPHFNSLVNDI